jgi:hypothetical protein
MNERATETLPARTTIRRLPEKANHDRAMLYGIVDEAYVCHIAFSVDDDTHCIPTAHWRKEDDLYIHGSNGSRMIKALSRGTQGKNLEPGHGPRSSHRIVFQANELREAEPAGGALSELARFAARWANRARHTPSLYARAGPRTAGRAQCSGLRV